MGVTIAARGCWGRGYGGAARSIAFACLVAAPLLARGQATGPVSPSLPFAVGERLTYRVRVSAAGNIGQGSMWIEGPVDVRGNQTVLLRSRFDAKVAWMKAFSESESWLDLATMSSLRFQKQESQPLSRMRERVDIYPDDQRWTSSAGTTGTSLTCAPLDELSYIYYIRTLPLTDSVFSSSRHYDDTRNPVTIRVLRRQTIHTGTATYATIVVEMRVRDALRFKNEGVITLYLTDDARRIPVRIESPAPLVGTAVFTLVSVSNSRTE